MVTLEVVRDKVERAHRCRDAGKPWAILVGADGWDALSGAITKETWGRTVSYGACVEAGAMCRLFGLPVFVSAACRPGEVLIAMAFGEYSPPRREVSIHELS